MRRRHGVRTHPIRHRSIGAHRVRTIVVADDRATGHERHARLTRLRCRQSGIATAPGRADAAEEAPVVAAPHPLSAREREVLGMLVHGLSNQAIASLLCISDRTVKSHAQAIYRKLDVANRTEAVGVAFRRGLVALDPRVLPGSDAA